jgi:hypothetical protein
MATLTRRGLMKRTAFGTAAAGALLVSPARTFAHATTAGEAPIARTSQGRTSIDARAPLGAYIHDIATGEITLLLGTREVTVRDPDLVRRLVQAAR